MPKSTEFISSNIKTLINESCLTSVGEISSNGLGKQCIADKWLYDRGYTLADTAIPCYNGASSTEVKDASEKT